MGPGGAPDPHEPRVPRLDPVPAAVQHRERPASARRRGPVHLSGPPREARPGEVLEDEGVPVPLELEDHRHPGADGGPEAPEDGREERVRVEPDHHRVRREGGARGSAQVGAGDSRLLLPCCLAVVVYSYADS